ncbi:phage baseplate assembly protein V [Apirhabdus apintestini]|nr:phage baseplate assembly protein V [Enterobacteriaceae bacterium CA-0114]
MTGVTLQTGTVSAVDAAGVKARVRLPECDNMRTNWLDVLQRNTQNNKDYWLPDVGEQVKVLLDENGEDGVILGAVYSDVDKPSFSDKDVRGTRYNDEASFSYNRATHTLTINGGIEHIVISVATNVSLTTKNVSVTAESTAIEGNVQITGNVAITGNVQATGDILAGGKNSNHHSH